MNTQELLSDINTNLVPSEINLKIVDLPKTLQNQIRFLEQLKTKQAEAEKQAKAAKEGADSLEAYVRKKFLGKEYLSGDNKQKIEHLQEVVKNLANSQESVTTATNISLKFQQSLSETSQFLLFLGCSNIASFNAVIDNINRIDKDGIGGNSISEDVKAKLKEVVTSLKERQDVMFRQEKMAKEFKKLVEELRPIIENLTISSDRISKLIDDHYNEFITAQKVFENNISRTQQNIERVQEELNGVVEKNFTELLGKINATDSALKNAKNEIEATIEKSNNRIIDIDEKLATTNRLLLNKESEIRELIDRERAVVLQDIESKTKTNRQEIERAKIELINSISAIQQNVERVRDESKESVAKSYKELLDKILATDGALEIVQNEIRATKEESNHKTKDIDDRLATTNQLLLNKEAEILEVLEREMSCVKKEIESKSLKNQQSLEDTKNDLEKTNTLLKRRLTISNVILIITTVMSITAILLHFI